MSQLSFSEAEFSGKRKQTRREKFLGEMERTVPWDYLAGEIAKHYPKAGKPGRQPYPIETMLRIHFMQQWFNLSDPGMEDALHDSLSIRQFAKLPAGRVPDETTILNFRHLLEKQNIAEEIFEGVNLLLQDYGLMVRRGTIVDATIIEAPSSTKNAEGARDPEMHQTKKGNTYFFGMKAHIGVDLHTGLVHSVVGTPANAADVTQAAGLLHGEEELVFGDAGYQGVDKRDEHQGRDVQWFIAMRPSKIAQMKRSLAKAQVEIEHMKASLRAKVEHPFQVIKRQFGYTKTRIVGWPRTLRS
ncbi:ISPssy%2C transposase [Bordetella ansorpii]|uniref:ISPssy, transposase n=1 Tax=Bordetella ansorpii TaxID=288768 RepID=A0A157SD30_9BORD|nr:ISPssy%2C transposase [Bordetella ansorpii]